MLAQRGMSFLFFSLIFCDHIRDFPWEDLFNISAFAASEFCEWLQVKNDVYIPH